MSEFHIRQDLPRHMQVEYARRWLYGSEGTINKRWMKTMQDLNQMIHNLKGECGRDWRDVEMLLKVAIGDAIENLEETDQIKESMDREYRK